jgi:MurNAc alpha-1-phosphate uridylyltransferase
LTDHKPKPLIDVSGRTLIDRALDQCERYGIGQVVVNTAYKAQMLEAHLAQRASPHIIISHESEPLETGGGIANALPLLGGHPFFSLNSDTICMDGPIPALTRMEKAWNPEHMDVLMLLHPVDRAIGYGGKGDFWLDTGGWLRRRNPENSAPYVFTGVQILHPRLFTDCPPAPFSMNVLYDRLRDSSGTYSRIGVVIHDGEWLHVGDPKGLSQAEEFLTR